MNDFTITIAADERLLNAIEGLTAAIIQKPKQVIKTVGEPKNNPAPKPEPKDATKAEAEPEINVDDNSEPACTIEELRKAFLELSTSKGKQAARDILSSLEVKSVSDIPKHKYNAAMAFIREGEE